MLEKFKKYFPSTSSGFKQTIQNVQQPFKKPAYNVPTPEKSDLEKPLNIENIKSYLKKKFPSTTAASIAGKSTSPMGILPSVAGSEDFVKAWKRKKERQHKSGFATYDFFPELHYLAPMEYKMIGAAPNFPEISGYSKYKLKFGFSLRDSIEGGSIGAGIKVGIDTKHIPGIYKSGGYVGWSHKTHNTLMAVDDYTLVRTKRNRMDYWKNEMEMLQLHQEEQEQDGIFII